MQAAEGQRSSRGVWVPGAQPFETPDGVGIPLVADSLVVVQMHYHPAGVEHEPDRTAVQLRVTELVTMPLALRVSAVRTTDQTPDAFTMSRRTDDLGSVHSFAMRARRTSSRGLPGSLHHAMAVARMSASVGITGEKLRRRVFDRLRLIRHERAPAW